jgi:hypothetical protein
MNVNKLGFRQIHDIDFTIIIMVNETNRCSES